MSFKRTVGTAAVMLLLSARAMALDLAPFDITLTVDTMLEDHCPEYVGVFGCIKVGDSFTGRFSVDRSTLLADGIYTNQKLYDLSITFGEATYSTGPDNEYLAGTAPRYPGSFGPSFRVASGQVVELYVSLAGGADIPFIDFPSYRGGTNRFGALDGPTYAEGSVAIASAVPEPEIVAMFLVGLGAVGLRVRRRR